MGKITYLARLFREVRGLGRAKKAYWLMPMVIALLLMAILVMVSEAVSPFIYTLF